MYNADQAESLKMWAVVRKDLVMPPGKLAVQTGHAFCLAMYRAQFATVSGPSTVSLYLSFGMTKIVVGCKNEDSLDRAFDECLNLFLPCAIITDAGRTVFNGPTKTVMVVGPCLFEELPKYVQKMQLY